MSTRAPTDRDILRALATAGRRVEHDVSPDGKHVINIPWQGGWSHSCAAHHEYSIALRMAFVGLVPFLTKATVQLWGDEADAEQAPAVPPVPAVPRPAERAVGRRARRAAHAAHARRWGLGPPNAAASARGRAGPG